MLSHRAIRFQVAEGEIVLCRSVPTENDYCRSPHAPVNCSKLISSVGECENEMTEPWTSVDDIARHLGVAKDSVYRWIERRNLPAHRIGRLWKFKISEVDAWVRAAGGGVDRDDPKKP